MNRLIRSLLQASCLGVTLGVSGLAAQAAPAPATEPARAAAEAPATKPAKPKLSEQFLQGQRNQRDSQRNSALNNRDAVEVNLADLVQLSLERGLLKADIQTPATANQVQRYKVKGSNAIWTASRSSFAQQQWINGGWVRTTITSTSLDRLDPEAKEDGDVWSTHVSVSGSSLSIRGQSVLGYIYFSQSNRQVVRPGVAAAPAVSLMVQEWAPMNNNGGIRMTTAFRGTASTLAELRAKSPEEFRKYLLPLLNRLSDNDWLVPGATDVYAVFSEIPADPQVSATVDGLLPELDADAFAAREAASKQLLELGPPAVLAVLRKDLTPLSDEQRAQIGRLVAAHRRRGDLSPAEARKDSSFLAECLEHPDAAVRAAAKVSLEKVLGEPLKLDPKQPPDQLAEAADGVRKKIAEMQSPATTQPAQPENGAAAPAPAIVIPAQRQVFVR